MPSHDDLDIPEITDFLGFRPGRYARELGEPLEIRIDGAIGYSLRLIPSNKVVARFSSTLQAWPAVAEQIERGVPARCLVLDWHGADGSRGQVSSGRALASTAASIVGPAQGPKRVRAAS
jgi:hypothetical protein